MPVRTLPLWVDAAPFRAHLLSLAGTTGVPWPVIALYAGLPVRLAEALVQGRDGRRVRRIPRECAQRLLEVSAGQVARIEQTWVPAAPTATRMAALIARGVHPQALAEALGEAPELLEGLAEAGPDAPGSVSQALALRVLALREQVDRAALHATASGLATLVAATQQAA